MLDPPPLKSDNHFFGNYTIFSALMEKKCIILFENPKTLGVGNAKCRANCYKCWSYCTK